MTDQQIGNVRRCARCRSDHDELPFKRFVQPIVDDDGFAWTHWATCPTSGDPILLANPDGVTAAGKAQHLVYGEPLPLFRKPTGTISCTPLVPKALVDNDGQMRQVELHWSGFGGLLDDLPALCVLTRGQVQDLIMMLRSALEKTDAYSFRGVLDKRP